LKLVTLLYLLKIRFIYGPCSEAQLIAKAFSHLKQFIPPFVSWASQALALLQTAAASASSQLWLSEDKLKETTALARRLTGHSGSVCYKPLVVLQDCGKVLYPHVENWRG
jgi:hypothetical protein